MVTSCVKNGITIDKWGPCAWNTLHCFAHCMPTVLTNEQQMNFKTFLYSFSFYLPCPTCRYHFHKYLDDNISELSFKTKDDVIQFVFDAHNDVNVRLGKAIFRFSDHNAIYTLKHTKKAGDVSTLVIILVVVFIFLRIKCRRRMITQKSSMQKASIQLKEC